MKKTITFLIITFTFLSINAQDFVEVKTNIQPLIGGNVSWGDYNKDGYLDLFIAGNDSSGKWFSKIYRNDNGIFIDIKANLLGVSMDAMSDWGDYDNDGDLDLLVSGADTTIHGQTRIYRNDSGVFTDIGANLIGLRDLCTAKWGDYNGDGKLDILLSGFSDDSSTYVTKIYKNIGNSFYDSNIQLPGTSNHKSTGWVDIDGDGDLDIFLAGDGLNPYAAIYLNNKGKFSKLTTNILSTYSGSSDWGDFDNDGELDLAIMGDPYSGSPISKIYRNDNNNFVDIGANLAGLKNGIIKWVDFDGDGKLDIFLNGVDKNGNLKCYLYRNDSGKFVSVPTDIPGLSYTFAAFGDYDNDNDLDLIINGEDNWYYLPFTKLYKNNIEKKLFVSQSFICDTSKSVMLSYVGDISSIDSFQWDFDGGTVLNGSNNGPLKIKWNALGDKNIRLILINKSAANDTLTAKISVFPGISVLLGNDTTISNGESVTLHPLIQGGSIPFKYNWNGNQGDSIKTFFITHDSLIFLSVQDNNNCRAQSNIKIYVPTNEFSEQICMVTVDTSSGKNTVVWQKTPGKNIKEYKVLKETTVSGVYSIIGTVPFSENGQYTDLGSEPTKHADRYKIATIDSSDLQIGLSNIHQTIHLAINQGLPGTYNLIWTPYVGFDYYTYYIYKGSSPGNLNLIDSLANTYIQYTDTAASVAYYQIGVRKSSPCIISKRKSGGEPFSQSISNLEDNLKYVGIKKVKSDLLIKVYPNPFNNEIVIESFIERPELFKIELFNVLGMKIYEYLTNKLISCNYKKVIHSYELTKASEMNILKVTVGDKIYFTKIIKR